MAGEPTTRPFTVDEYYRMAEAGILGEDDRVELLDGEIVQMSPVGVAHSACVDLLTRALEAVRRHAATIRVQSPIRLGKYSEPEPDVSVLRGQPRDYVERHPGPADVLLVVEVADTSLLYDRRRKVPAYARSGIPEVWLVDLPAKRVSVFRGPGADGYGTLEELAAGDELTIQAIPAVTIPVRDILP